MSLIAYIGCFQAKRIVIYMARAKPDCLVEEIINELRVGQSHPSLVSGVVVTEFVLQGILRAFYDELKISTNL